SGLPPPYSVDKHHPAIIGQQLHIPFKIRPADTVEDNIDRPRSQPAGKIFRFVVDAGRSAQLYTEITFFRRTRSSVNRCPETPRKLDSRCPYPTAATVDQHRLPCLERP